MSPLVVTTHILRPAQVAERLAITRSTLNRWRQRDDFPKPLRLGPQAIGWRRADIERWLSDRPTA